MKTLEEVQRGLIDAHRRSKSWRFAGHEYGLNPATARMIANGYIPKEKLCARLGLPPQGRVSIVFGAVPDGSQVLAAQQCACGQWFISNHPARKRCFICGPYKRGNGHEHKS